jgi:hypothetical protein
MARRLLLALSVGMFAFIHGVSAQQSGGPGSGQSRHGHDGLGLAGGGFGYFTPFYLAGIGPNGPFVIVPPPMVGPGGGPMAPPRPQFDSGRSRAGPIPPDAPQGIKASPGQSKPKRGDPVRAGQLVKLGDRLFRAGNQKRAQERYDQAIKSDPHNAAPRVRLAQIALVRGNFAEAAQYLRDAQRAEPGWVVTASDIQAIYPEPSDFSKQIAKLESHLQANPDNRDAWLVLGAELYLSGRTQKASDVFLRLSDRKPDPVLAAFLEATESHPTGRD